MKVTLGAIKAKTWSKIGWVFSLMSIKGKQDGSLFVTDTVSPSGESGSTVVDAVALNG